MKIRYNLTNFIVILLLFACSSNKKPRIIEYTGKSFYSVDSIYSVVPNYKIEGNSFTMGLELEKQKDDGSYYFPTSEQLRVIIKDNKGTTILNTGSNQNFTTSISPVEPQLLGEKQGYVYSLTGIALFEERDEIEIVMILPIKPNEIMYRKRVRLDESK